MQNKFIAKKSLYYASFDIKKNLRYNMLHNLMLKNTYIY